MLSIEMDPKSPYKWKVSWSLFFFFLGQVKNILPEVLSHTGIFNDIVLSQISHKTLLYLV